VSAPAFVLPPGLPRPVPEADQLDAPYWEGTRAGELRVQRCRACRGFQWGPEWICHRCLAFDLEWVAVAPRGRIYSWERAWHPVHPALPEAGHVRMIGNLTGDPMQEVTIGASVEAVFEPHDDATPPFTLVQWKR